MCGICAALRPYDPDCPYTGLAATAAHRILSQLENLGIEIADAAALFGDPIALQQTLPFDPWEGIGFPELDPTGFAAFYDIPSGPSTGVYLSPGMRLNAEISWLGDTDWFGMQLQQGQTYQISMTSLPFIGVGDPQLYLFDNNANLLLIDDNSGGGVNALLTITATRTGVYFVGATGFGGGGSTTGHYQISLSQVNFAADTVGDTRGSATRIEVNNPVTGSIDFIGDGDMYRVRIEKGKSYYVVLDAINDRLNPLGDPRVQLFDRNGTLLGENDDNGITRNSFLSFDATVTGDVFLRAMGVGNTTGDFRLSVVELQPPPPVPIPFPPIRRWRSRRRMKPGIRRVFAGPVSNSKRDSPAMRTRRVSARFSGSRAHRRQAGHAPGIHRKDQFFANATTFSCLDFTTPPGCSSVMTKACGLRMASFALIGTTTEEVPAGMSNTPPSTGASASRAGSTIQS